MPPRRSRHISCSDCGIRDDIPEEVRNELAHIGGIGGLCSRIPGNDDLQSASRISQALSDPVRLKILYLLGVQPLCVCVIKQCVAIADSKLSYHLNILKEAGLIEGETRKTWIIYHLTEKGRVQITPPR